jgi:hypothetical protein
VTLLVVLGIAYLVFLACTLAVLTVAKRADEQAERQGRALRGSVETLPDHDVLGRVAAEVCAALQAERVSVVLSDPNKPTTGVIRACVGAPGLLGSRVLVEATPAVGALGASEAPILGLARQARSEAWTYAHVPIAGPREVVGAVTAASRSRTFAEADLALIERVARRGGRPFDRRRRPRPARA